ncbi:MAG: hypothetical protein ACREQQ_18240 [Candidatus Binatia bacterium]
MAQTIRHLRGADDQAEIGDTLAGAFVHAFTEEEIGGELRAAGFEPVCFRRQPYGHAVGRAMDRPEAVEVDEAVGR